MRLLSKSIVVGCVGVLLAIDGFLASAAEPRGEFAERMTKVQFDHYAEAPGYSEGPTWLKGEVFFCSGALLRVDANKKTHKFLEIGPAGTVLKADGHLLIADNKHKAILDLSPNGAVEVIVEQFEGKPLRSLNDLTIDAQGNIYWTDPEGSTPEKPVGQVFRLRTDGRVDLVATGLAFPNGLDVDPASKFLYVIESQSKKILRYALPEDVRDPLGPMELFYDLGGSGGDGCAFDEAGNLWSTDFHRPETGKGRITVLSPQAEVLAYLPLPAKVVSNIAFGGPKHDEIYCTTGEPPGVFHAAVGVRGFKGHPGKPTQSMRKLNVVIMLPHPDSDAVRKIVATAKEAQLKDGRFDDETQKSIKQQIAGLTNSELGIGVLKILPDLELAAAQAQHDAPLLAEIKRLNGKATLEVTAPDWLRSLAGDEALGVFARLVELDLNERTDGHKEPEPKTLADRVTDDWLKRIADQTLLRRLELSGTAVTSAGMAHLADLTNLERLNVCLTAVDDEGLSYLGRLTKIRRMTVCASKITGSGFQHLQGMKLIESINLHSSPASDAGLAAIGGLTSLRRLEIVHTHVTDAGLAHIANLTNLRQLHVHGPETTQSALPFLGKLTELYELDIYDQAASNQSLSQIALLPKLRMLRLFGGPFDDAGVKHLANLATLEELVLNSSQVTDASIDHLSGLKQLRKLGLEGTKVTETGRTRLRELLPKATITP